MAGQQWKEITLLGLLATNAPLSPTLDLDARGKALSAVLNISSFVSWPEQR